MKIMQVCGKSCCGWNHLRKLNRGLKRLGISVELNTCILCFYIKNSTFNISSLLLHRPVETGLCKLAGRENRHAAEDTAQ